MMDESQGGEEHWWRWF